MKVEYYKSVNYLNEVYYSLDQRDWYSKEEFISILNKMRRRCKIGRLLSTI